MSFGLYLLGFAIVIGGVAWALVTAGVPGLYVMIVSAVAAVMVEKVSRPAVEHPQPSLVTGLVPALVYLGGAVAYVMLCGWW